MNLNGHFYRYFDAATDGDQAGAAGGAADDQTTQATDATQGTEGGEKTDAPKGPQTALEAAAAALKPAEGEKTDAEGKDAAKTDAKAQGDTKDTGKDTKAAKPEDDAYKMPDGLKPESQERFRALANDNKALRTKQTEYETEVRPWREMQSWVKQSGLQEKDVSYGLELMRLVRNDPHKAWETLQPLVAHLQPIVGEKLPDDLAGEVEAGRISEEHAKELAAARSRTKVLTEREQRQNAEREQNDRRSQVQKAIDGISAALTVWENDWKSSDPDYSKKQRFVKSRVAELIATEGAPRNTQEALAQAKKARQQIEDEMRGFMPERRETRTLTGGTNARTVQVPKTSLEAAKLALTASAS